MRFENIEELVGFDVPGGGFRDNPDELHCRAINKRLSHGYYWYFSQ